MDALVQYGAEDVSEEMDRSNPEWTKLTRRLKQARTEVERLGAQLGSEVTRNEEGTRRTMRGFKIAHAQLRQQLEQAEAQVEQMNRG